ncbi:CDC48 family AAA ATPase [Desulfurococcus mucosus]|uniref:AAA family ATPase, CDC48 subfamily n=1 Tax=Desulfurococcus mucosus (strain ATCC 35584 / DSM 2162 / JCM 9187 / O7/1) TaxID=765177 RepID=E8RA81_DESM0|nr:CDC48 family AAA ATPase [Desulfurococcus mucosus]ADV65387.1 AAA family ATPase, CDC48 subfamily [Desulfurococcus mucosus DSM 2162]
MVRLVLKVLDAERRDYGKGIARLDPEVMEKYGIMDGDLLVIEGEAEAAALAGTGGPQDKGRGVVRLDPLLRANARAEIGASVTVEKVERRYARVVKLAPTNYHASIDDHVLESIRNKLIGHPVMEDNEIHVTIVDIPVPFRVVSVKPRGPAIITDETEVYVFEEPVGEFPRVTFDDIGGLGNVIDKIREMIEIPLKYRKVFRKLGVDPPKGILLYGPPGTGKTLLAKALANEVNAYFITINGPEIMSKYYGESEQRLREIFKLARKKSKKNPAIIFIDEIDAIAPKRDEVIGEVERRVVAQLLALMDGLESRGNVIVIAATNRPNALDPALRRPGRFDREIEIPMPDKKGRLEILKIHTRRLSELGVLSRDVDLAKIAEITHGYTGADLAALVKEAVLHAIRRQVRLDTPGEWPPPDDLLSSIKVTFEDFLFAYRSIVPSGLREIHVEVPDVRWSDIGGLEEVKRSLRENVELPLKHPEIYEKYGIKPPKGVLLYGPPGCGKTLLAKAVATESGANFIAVKGPEVLSKWVGESEKAVREIFRKARLYAPVVVFFDEIDAIASLRGIDTDSGVSERVVTQLVTEMDGVQKLENVVVLAATNRPDLLDPALLRPGRFDKLIYVPPPDYNARLEILRVHTRSVPLDRDVDLAELARSTEGYSGADLEAVVREAVMLALRESPFIERVGRKHFIGALELVKPSINEALVKFYLEWGAKARQSLPRHTVKPSIYT